jgi:lipopolysaccharide export system permease protein
MPQDAGFPPVPDAPPAIAKLAIGKRDRQKHRMLALFTMNRLDRYIFRQLALGLVAITTGLVALIWLTQSLRFIQLIVNHGLSPLVFIHLTFLLVPSFVAVILPITCFIVVLFIYARLAADRELTVMRAAGLSDLSLARPALVLAGLVMLSCYVLNLWLVPASLTNFRNYEFEIRNKIAAFLLEPGVFTPIPGHITVYVQNRAPDDSLHGILIEDERQKSEPATILARSGQLVAGPDGPEVLLKDGSREQIDPRTGRLNVLKFKQNMIDLAQANKSKESFEPNASEASMRDLLHPNPAKIPPATRKKWHAEVYRRMATPLNALSYTVFALFAVLGVQFRRHGGLVGPSAAVAAVVVLVALGIGVDNLAARQNDLLPLIWLTPVLPGAVGAPLLFLKRRWRQLVPA